MKKMTSNQKLPYAIVIGLDCITGLQSARLLAQRGVPVIALAKNPGHYCAQTRVCERIVPAQIASVELVHTLEELGAQLEQRAVLFPCTDMSVLVLSRHRLRLQKYFHLALPAPEVVEMLMDKIGFYTYAQQQGLPIPATYFLKNRYEAEAAAEMLQFPCILKPPMKTPKWEQHTKAKVFKIASAQEFLALYARCSTWADTLMVQEWIAGRDHNLYSCNCYFNAKSQPLATFVARKLRQWPPETGTSCLGEEVRNDTVLQETLRLFRGVQYHGLGYVEMKRDERTGLHYIIEPNIGRPTGRSAIAEAGGVDLLYAKYCDLAGLPLPEQREQKYRGVKWIYFRRDLQSAFYYWRRGELSLREWWRTTRGHKAYAVWSWRDPKPFFYDWFRLLRSSRPQSGTVPPPAKSPRVHTGQAA